MLRKTDNLCFADDVAVLGEKPENLQEADITRTIDIVTKVSQMLTQDKCGMPEIPTRIQSCESTKHWSRVH